MAEPITEAVRDAAPVGAAVGVLGGSGWLFRWWLSRRAQQDDHVAKRLDDLHASLAAMSTTLARIESEFRAQAERQLALERLLAAHDVRLDKLAERVVWLEAALELKLNVPVRRATGEVQVPP